MQACRTAVVDGFNVSSLQLNIHIHWTQSSCHIQCHRPEASASHTLRPFMWSWHLDLDERSILNDPASPQWIAGDSAQSAVCCQSEATLLLLNVSSAHLKTVRMYVALFVWMCHFCKVIQQLSLLVWVLVYMFTCILVQQPTYCAWVSQLVLFSCLFYSAWGILILFPWLIIVWKRH